MEITGVRTVEQYLRAVDEIYALICPPGQPLKHELWFRGVKNTNYNLEPTIARGLGVQAEIVYLSKFRSLAYPYVGDVPYFPFSEDRDSYWGWLFMMQHYGVPTRLLDWSREALIGLLFAVDPDTTEEEAENDPAVWFLNPVELNKAFQFYDFLEPGYIPNATEPAFNTRFGPDAKTDNVKAAAAIGPLNNPRIIKQAGTFTVYPVTRRTVALNLLPDANKYLYKIVLEKEARVTINEQLRHYGLTQHDLFPEISRAAADIQREIRAEDAMVVPGASKKLTLSSRITPS
ncbi:FRG domain-containing protein [Paenibacillus lemnae]|uniref:FRG domain-containing protein n=2 Tax=Paenibacillus lemnae TaxID=1330551 RepID=A0A848M3Y6_PAELE|nr:FRG domain-containing protein [Paenibacillus lemnae]